MITSLTNEKIKELVKLNNSKNRKLAGKFLVEGPHLVLEAKNAGVLEMVITTDANIEGLLVSEAVMKKIANTVNPVKVIGLCKMIKKEEISNRVLILDDIQDPTNLGTILRTAKAFGFNTVFASNNTVDFYNDKVIRGSQGAIFKLNLIAGDIISFINKLKNTHEVYGTNVRNGIDVKDITCSNNIAVILGNEGRGVKEEVEALCHKNLYIALDNMESLNVSVAGAILMYELAKK